MCLKLCFSALKVGSAFPEEIESFRSEVKMLRTSLFVIIYFIVF